MSQKYTKNEYQKIIDKKVPSSKCVKNCINAFLIGGTICTIGQCFLSFYKSCGMSEEISGSLTSVSMIFLGILLTGLNVYHKIAKYGGAGTLVPITGFANAVSSPAIEAKTEGYILGVGAKIFTIAGPVILYGIAASSIYGIIYFIIK